MSYKIDEITFDEFEKKQHEKKEGGIVLLGAGGELSEWIEGVIGVWKEEDIVAKDIKNEDVFSEFSLLETTGGRTDLCMFFNSKVELDMGRMAMWRLRFGDCSWPDDYVVNYAKHF